MDILESKLSLVILYKKKGFQCRDLDTEKLTNIYGITNGCGIKSYDIMPNNNLILSFNNIRIIKPDGQVIKTLNYSLFKVHAIDNNRIFMFHDAVKRCIIYNLIDDTFHIINIKTTKYVIDIIKIDNENIALYCSKGLIIINITNDNIIDIDTDEFDRLKYIGKRMFICYSPWEVRIARLEDNKLVYEKIDIRSLDSVISDNKDMLYMIIRDELGDKYLYSYNTLTKEKKRIGHISQEMGSIYLLYDSYSDRIIVIKSDSIMVVNAKSYMCHRINNSIEQIRDCHLINLNRDKYIKLTQLFLVKYVNNNIAMTVAKFI